MRRRVRVWGLGPGLSFLCSDFLPEHQAGFEGLQAEECGVLNGCENGRCVRVREGYTCDCFEGFQLDMAHMACVGEFGVSGSARDADWPSWLCGKAPCSL